MNNNARKLHYLFLILMAAFMLFTLVACDFDSINAFLYGEEEEDDNSEDEGDGECIHDFQKTFTEKGTCLTEGVEIWTCTKCSITERRKGELGGHTYDESNPYICSVCGDYKAPLDTYRSGGATALVYYAPGSGSYSDDPEFVLVFIGSGQFSSVPWASYLAQIKSIRVYGTDIGFGMESFKNARLLSEVYFDPGCYVSSIGERAFLGCDNLEKLTLPSGIKSIGKNAFDGCTYLFDVFVADTLIYMGEGAFSGCENLETLEVPFFGTEDRKGNNSLFASLFAPVKTGYRQAFLEGEGGYEAPSQMKGISLNRNEDILPYSFSNLTSSIDLVVFAPGKYTAEGVSIGEYAFYRCVGLKEFVSEDSRGISSMGAFAFYGCSSLEKFSLPVDISVLPESAFGQCQSMVSFDIIGGNLVEIGKRAFEGCVSLKKIYLPGSLTAIYAGAFANCSNLSEIHLGASLQMLGSNVFESCSSLINVYILSQYVAYMNNDSLLFYYRPNLWIAENITINGGFIEDYYACYSSDYLTTVGGYRYYLWEKKKVK